VREEKSLKCKQTDSQLDFENEPEEVEFNIECKSKKLTSQVEALTTQNKQVNAFIS